MSDESMIQKFVMNLVETVMPNEDDIRRAIADLRKAHPSYTNDELADSWTDTNCWLYAAEGAVTALPGAIPGLGTAVQVGVETVAISADLAYMLRCMAGMVLGVGIIYDRDLDSPFNQRFLKVLGLWCGVLSPAKEATIRVLSKVVIAEFNRQVPAKVFARINQRIATTIVAKYAAKRGGISLGRLIPFGVGAIVGGGFNLVTMKGFKKAAVAFYRSDKDSVLVEND